MIDRRHFLNRCVMGGVGLALASCQARGSGLKLAVWEGALPVPLITAFERQDRTRGSVRLSQQATPAKLYGQLETWASDQGQQRGAIADWVSLPDAWLGDARQPSLIQSIDSQALGEWPTLAPVWSQLLRQDAQGPGEAIWGVPYRWTALGILYDTDRLETAAPIQGWGDLLQPQLQQRLMVPDQERLVLGLGLKALGSSANPTDLSTVQGLEDWLGQLHRQVRWYSSQHTLKALITGDAWAVVGWLDALLPVLAQYPNLRLVIPQEGTLASADLWLRPQAAAPPTPRDWDWLNFCLSQDFATTLGIYNQALAPRLWGLSAEHLPTSWRRYADRLEASALLTQSEFLKPLSPAVQAAHTALWQQLRRS
jgi:putative spermidine/putrescine transport system substrate-binding protein